MLHAAATDTHRVTEIEPSAMTRLDKYTFSTTNLPRDEQFSAWWELVAPVADLRSVRNQADGFEAEETTWDLESIALTRCTTPDIEFFHTYGHLRSFHIDHWVISCSRRGGGRTLGPSKVVTSVAGVPEIRTLGSPFRGTMPATTAVYLFVPRDFCRGIAASLDAVDNTSLTGGLGRLLADYLFDLDRRLPMLTLDDLPGTLAATRAMITACVHPSAEALAEAQRPIDATLLERARQIIQRDLHMPDLGSDTLCRELGISRSRLYRLFEPMGGVVHHIRSRRLLEVHARLVDPDDSRRISQIAAEHGYDDPAEFSRAFRREFGYRPTDARNNVGHPLPRHATKPHSADGRDSFADVLRSIH